MRRFNFQVTGKARASNPPPQPQVVGVAITTVAPSPFYTGMVYDIDFTTTLSDGSTNINPALGVQFTSSNPSVATVDPITGRVTALLNGSVTITWRIGGITGTIPLTITTPTQTVTQLVPARTAIGVSNLAPAQSFSLAPQDGTGALVTGRTITPSGHNTGVCTVSITGYTATVVYVGTGTTTITFTCDGQTCQVAVSATTAATGQWYDAIVGLDKVIMVHPGNLVSSAQRVDIGTMLTREATRDYNFVTANYGQWWSTKGSPTGNLNQGGAKQYYDGMIVMLMASIMSGESAGGTFYNQAVAIGQDYRDFLATTGTTPGFHWVFPETLLALWLMFGDTVAKAQLNRLARAVMISTLIPPAVVKDSANGEGREVARRMLLMLCCHKAGLGPAEGVIRYGGGTPKTYNSWLEVAVDYADHAVTSQITAADGRNDGLGHDLAGSFNWGFGRIDLGLTSNNDGQTNYQVCILMDAIWKVHQLVPKQAYLDCMAASWNYLKTTQFSVVGTNGEGFMYQNRDHDAQGHGTVYRDANVGNGQPDLGSFYAQLAFRVGDVTFARRCLGINAANQFGSSQVRCGALGWRNNPANFAYYSPPANINTGYQAQLKNFNEVLGGAGGTAAGEVAA